MLLGSGLMDAGKLSIIVLRASSMLIQVGDYDYRDVIRCLANIWREECRDRDKGNRGPRVEEGLLQ